MSFKLSNFKYTKNIEVFVENITEIVYSYEDEKPPEFSEDGQM